MDRRNANSSVEITRKVNARVEKANNRHAGTAEVHNNIRVIFYDGGFCVHLQKLA